MNINPGRKELSKSLVRLFKLSFSQEGEMDEESKNGGKRRREREIVILLFSFYNFITFHSKNKRSKNAGRMKIVLKDFLRLNKFFLSLISFRLFEVFLCCFFSFISLDYGEVFFSRAFAKSA